MLISDVATTQLYRVRKWDLVNSRTKQTSTKRLYFADWSHFQLQTLLTEQKVRRMHINIHIYFGNAKLFQYDSLVFGFFFLRMQY